MSPRTGTTRIFKEAWYIYSQVTIGDLFLTGIGMGQAPVPSNQDLLPWFASLVDGNSLDLDQALQAELVGSDPDCAVMCLIGGYAWEPNKQH